MGEQSSICVQKKTILALAMIIFAMMIYLFKMGTEDIENYQTVATNYMIENENDCVDITSENAKFAAVQVIEETISFDNTESLQNDILTEEIIEVGNKQNVSHETSSENTVPSEYACVINASSTAYCLCTKCCGKSAESIGYGVTASGFKIVPGTGAKVIAVDPSVIPLGSKVYVENANGVWDYGYAVAADTGSAIVGTKVDLYMDTHEEALSWGRRNVKVYVIE